MTNEQLFAKIREYPVSTVFTILGLLALGVCYWRWDIEAELSASRETLDRELGAIRQRETASRNLDKDVQRIVTLRERLSGLAMNFDDPIETQSFFANFVRRAPVEAEGLPMQDALPVFFKSAEPFAAGPYKTQISADFNSSMAYLRSINAQSVHPMVVRRIQIVATPGQSKPDSFLTTDVLFSVWGRRGDFGKISAPADKTVTPPLLRSAKINAVEELLEAPKTSFAASTNPFASVGSSPSVQKTHAGHEVDPELSAALNKLAYTIEPFLGARSVKVAGSMPKRVGNDLEVHVGTRVVKVRIHSIEAEGFTVLTVNGAKITISPKK